MDKKMERCIGGWKDGQMGRTDENEASEVLGQ